MMKLMLGFWLIGTSMAAYSCEKNGDNVVVVAMQKLSTFSKFSDKEILEKISDESFEKGDFTRENVFTQVKRLGDVLEKYMQKKTKASEDIVSSQRTSNLLKYQNYGQDLNRIIPFNLCDDKAKKTIKTVLSALLNETDEKIRTSDRFQYCVAFVLLNEEKISELAGKQDFPIWLQCSKAPLDLMKESAKTYGPASDFIEYFESAQLENDVPSDEE